MGKDKLIKTVVIARSGVYKYRPEELPSLGLSLEQAPEKKEAYLVYRPSLVLSRDKDKFKMLTLTNGHPNELVDSNNFKQLSIGFTGEQVDEEWNEESQEVVLKTKVALVEDKALENYYTGIDEVSPGYLATFEWKKGITPKGEDYDIIMMEIEDGNHLAMTPKARGGSVACIIDSEGGNMSVKKFMSSLWRNVRKRRSGVKDEDKQFRTVCDELSIKKDSLSDEDIKTRVQGLRDMCSDFPESDEKNILLRYLDDFGIVKEKDAESAKLASDQISNLYEKLDSESQGEIKMDNDPKKPEEGQVPNIASASDASTPEEVFIEGLENLFMEYHKMKNGEDEEVPEEGSLDEESTDPLVPPKKPDASTEDEDTKEPDKKPVGDSAQKPKKSVGDSMSNITIDSSDPVEGGLSDFFKTKIKGGKK